MRPEARSRADFLLPRVTGAASGTAGGLAVLTLIGWWEGWTTLSSLLPGHPAMNPLTSVGIILCAAALWGQRRAGPGSGESLGRICAGLAAGVGVLRLLTIDLGVEPAPHQWLFHSRLAAAPVPSHMGVHTALVLACVGLALLTIDLRPRHGVHLTDLLVLVGIAVPMVALVGYFYSAAPLHGFMAINTAFAFLLLAIGTLLARPDRGLC